MWKFVDHNQPEPGFPFPWLLGKARQSCGAQLVSLQSQHLAILKVPLVCLEHTKNFFTILVYPGRTKGQGILGNHKQDEL